MTPTEKLNIALRAMAMENSLLQSYRALFIGIEAALLASAFAFIKLKVWNVLLGVSIAGLIINGMWIATCVFKGKDVDKWMNYLRENSQGTDLQGQFDYMKSGITFEGGRIARHWFNEVMPGLIIALWTFFLVWNWN